MENQNVPQKNPENNIFTEKQWKPLYRAGAIAPLIALATYVIEIIGVILAGDPYPTSSLQWFTLFADNKLIGLLALNVFDVVSIALLGVMFLALYMAMRRGNESIGLIAAFFALLGITVFVASRADMGSTMLKLSEEYAAATSQIQKDQLLAVGQALAAPVRATIDTMGYFFIAAASMLISVVILRSGIFNKATAYVGILGFVITLVSRLSLVFETSLPEMLLPVGGLIWLIWWVLVSRGLFRLARESR
jgi:hypothetical protein